MTLRSSLLLALLVAGCSSATDLDADGTSAWASEDPFVPPVATFAIYTDNRMCLGQSGALAFASACDEDSELFSWDYQGQIRSESGDCLTSIEPPNAPQFLSPLIGPPLYFGACGNGQQWAASEGRIWQPDPVFTGQVRCLEFLQQSSSGGLVFRHTSPELEACGTGTTWRMAARPPAGGPVPHTCSAELRVQNSWDGGFVGEVDVTLVDPGVDGWTMEWTFGAGGPGITSLWNAGSWSQDGDSVTVTDAGWNAQVGIHETVTVGFVAEGAPPAGDFEEFFFNELDCLNPQVSTNLNGPPAFPIWTLDVDDSCLVPGLGDAVQRGDCEDALLFRWVDGELQTDGGLCLHDPGTEPQLTACGAPEGQSWSRSPWGELYTGNEADGYSCIADGDEGLFMLQSDSLIWCLNWNMGTPAGINNGDLCTAEVTAINSWPGGFVGEATFTWHGPTTANWQADWSFDNGEVAYTFWNGAGFQNGDGATVLNEPWNGVLETGGAVSIGFVANGELGSPSDFELNGYACGAP